VDSGRQVVCVLYVFSGGGEASVFVRCGVGAVKNLAGGWVVVACAVMLSSLQALLYITVPSACRGGFGWCVASMVMLAAAIAAGIFCIAVL
jgi:hypothetical protein